MAPVLISDTFHDLYLFIFEDMYLVVLMTLISNIKAKTNQNTILYLSCAHCNQGPARARENGCTCLGNERCARARASAV